MSTTIYNEADLINQVILDNSADGATDLGSPPYCNIQGASGGAISGGYTPDTGSFNESTGNAWYQYDVNHDTPPNPIPATARITKVDITLQVNNASSISDMAFNVVSGAGSPVTRGISQCGATLKAFIIPSPADTTWASVYDKLNSNVTDTSLAGANTTAAESLTPDPVVLHLTFDFTTNPGGDFPLGYMTYSDFIANFAQMVFIQTALSSSNGTLTGTPLQNGTTFSGTMNVGVDLETSLFQMEVTWNLPLAWTISPSSITYPDNVVTLSRPVPVEDDEQIEKVYFNDTPIGPDDPWVIVWLKYTIQIHINIKLLDDPDNIVIKVDLIGTEFSGSVVLGTLTVTYADLSGIYKFDTTAHTDTLYDRSNTLTPTTTTVAIPAPFLVTYFVDNEETDVMHYIGSRIRVTGQGTLHQVFQSLDYVNTQTFGDLTLRTSNNISPFAIANFIDQQASLRLYMDNTSDYMNVSQIVIFSKDIATGYPQ